MPKKHACTRASVSAVSGPTWGALAVSVLLMGAGHAQEAAKPLPEVVVQGDEANALTPSGFDAQEASIGPLGEVALQDAPFSVNVIPREMIANQQANSLSDLMRYLPSTQMEARGGMDVGRPQSRGMQGDVVANTLIDGMNIAGTTAYPMEMLERVEVINGLTGPLYGPANPAGNFNLILKRPTDKPLRSLTLGYKSKGAGTVHADIGGRLGEQGAFGYRLNLLKEGGEGYVKGSDIDRKLVAIGFDWRLQPDTVLELNASHYRFDKYGFPGSFSYGVNTQLPDAPDASKPGFGQRFTGMELETNSGSARLRHRFSDQWSFEAGMSRQIVDRYLRTATNAVQPDGETFAVSTSSSYPGRFVVQSNMARLNGEVHTGTVRHELSLSTTGYDWQIYSANQASQRYNLGNASFSNPVQFESPASFARAGGVSYSSSNRAQSYSLGDVMHFSPQWSAMVFASYAKLKSTGYNEGGISSALSVTYKPAEHISVYASYADTLQSGGTAGELTANEGETLKPVRSKQYELGLRYATVNGLNLGATLFDVERPFAFTGEDNYYRVQGSQHNRGLELTAQGDLGARWAIYGGVTLLDAKLEDTPDARTRDKRVVGVPKVQAALLAQYSVAQVPGLALTGGAHYTGSRSINTAQTATIGSYYTLDLGARYTTRLMGNNTVWRLSVNNLTNQKYWVSIFPGNSNGTLAAGSAFLGDPREVRASLTMEF